MSLRDTFDMYFRTEAYAARETARVQAEYNALALAGLPPAPEWEFSGSGWRTTTITYDEQRMIAAAQSAGAALTRRDRRWNYDAATGNYTPGEVADAVCITGGR